MRAVVARTGLPATARSTRRIRSRRDGPQLRRLHSFSYRSRQAFVRRSRGILRRPGIYRRANRCTIERALRRDSARAIDPKRASMEQRPGDPRAMRALLGAPAPDLRPWGAGTIHVTAADRDGNMIAVTASGGWIPSSPVIDALGFPLGTRMQTFYLDERHPNALKPGKRPRTTLSPSLAMRAGEPYLAFGTPGGDQQDQWTLQFFLNVIDFGMNLQAAIEAAKFSSAHFPGTFYPHDNRPG